MTITQDLTIQGPADRIVRALYNEYVGGDGSLRRMVDRLAELDHVKDPKAQLRLAKADWKLAGGRKPSHRATR